MNRRKLLSGAAALSAYAALPKGAWGQAQPPPPRVFPRDIAYRQPVQMMLCGNADPNMLASNNASNIDSTNNSMNTRRTITVPTNCDITDIVLGFPGFAMTNAGGVEQNIPAAYTVTAAIEYPLGATPRQVFFNGATSATINPGRVLIKSDPFPNGFPAGAQVGVKTYVTWTGTFWMMPGESSTLAPPASNPAVAGDWTNRGVGLTDQTLAVAVSTQTTNGEGFSPIIFARPKQRVAVLGILGDSIAAGLNDKLDPTSNGTAFVRAMRNKMPMGTVCQGGFSMAFYLARQEGQSLILRDSCTHLISELGINDISAGLTLPQMQANWHATNDPFMTRGVKLYAWTLTPHTTSTDAWITTVNQTVLASEAVRLAYNTWLRTSWQALGCSGLIDAARAIDPTDSGSWSTEGGPVPTSPAAGYATISGGIVTSVAQGTGFQVGATVGGGYPNATQLPWTSYPFPGETGSGAAGTVLSNGAGLLTAWTVVTGGSGYSAPPLINLLGPWTADGLHPMPRAWNEIIFKTQLGPALFTL